ncbi:putative pt repeat family protein [Rosellinia necatrix]|uniref:Putative pt repeat family protein n=1 Tax=Rosellinia necatrix TaxID=77044 RepID=A0A1S7UJY1_ROSNE|nr:putative pt repeat family protein [Rosellinia necatrix]
MGQHEPAVGTPHQTLSDPHRIGRHDMATQGHTNNKTKTGFGGFPARLKSLVRDMKNFPKDIYRWRGTRSEGTRSQPHLPSEGPTPTAIEATSIAETRSLFQDSRHVRSLSVRVTVKFGEPLNYSHSQDYEGSSSLQPTEELCEALIRRVDHCSKELITRKDTNALDRTGSDGLAKPLRYEIQLQVLRNDIGAGTEAWASRTLRSYQRQPLGTETAREVILSTHYMVGLFLRHHDEAFVWKDGPVREDAVQEQKTFQYRPGRVQPLTSIPRSFFIEKQQDFESIPGYTITLSFTSQNHHRTPRRWHETIEVHSHQLSPLTLANAENLFLDACYSIDGVFRSHRKELEELQKSCAGHSGCQHCRPQDGDSVEMMLSVKNNVGPQFDNLERTTSTSVNVFWKDHAADCVEFVEKAKMALVQVSRDADQSLSWMNDFEFYIIELRGRGWTIDEPLAFTLGPETCICRRTVETLLDRLQTGVAEVLRGNAIAVRMTARKRGHFILHKTLVAREPIEKSGSKKKSAEQSKAYVLGRLKQRIERDIEMVCKDTCTIPNRHVETAQPEVIISAPSQEYVSMHTGLLSSRRLSDLTAPSKSQITNEEGSSMDRLGSRGSELLETTELSSASSSDSLARVTRDPATGARLFPLVPGRRTSHPAAAASSRGSSSRHNNFSRYDTTATSLDVSISHEQSNTLTTQTTSSSSTSNTGQESAKTSLTGSHNSRRTRHTADGSTVSTRPRTPDLESGGSPSIHSSVMVTPKIHGAVLYTEVDIARTATPDIGAGEIDGHENIGNYPSKLSIHQLASSPMPRLPSQDSSVASLIVKTRPMHKKQHLASPEGERSPILETEIPSLCEVKTKGSSGVKVIADAVSNGPIIEHDTPMEGEGPAVASEDKSEKDVFSQSKPDFDFSSPLTATSSQNSVSAEGASLRIEKSNTTNGLDKQQENQDMPTLDDSDGPVADPSSSGRPGPNALQKRQSKSFGSAGYLGSFNEQGFYGVGLRRALAGSSTPPPRPFSRLSFREGEEEQGSSGAAV